MRDSDPETPTIRLILPDEQKSGDSHSTSSLDGQSEEITFRRSRMNESIGQAVVEDQHKVVVGLSIRMHIPGADTEILGDDCNHYFGEILGQGISKFVFGLHRFDGHFNGKVFKMVKKPFPNDKPDMEPEVFADAQRAVPPSFAPKIHYSGVAVDEDSQKRYQCWITDRTIPLDEFCKSDLCIKERCSLAAFYCCLEPLPTGYTQMMSAGAISALK